MNNPIRLYMSMSLDGFIAGPGGEFDFSVMNDDLAEALNARFPETVERIARGRRGPVSRYDGTGVIPPTQVLMRSGVRGMSS